jgi:hypothetical protein
MALEWLISVDFHELGLISSGEVLLMPYQWDAYPKLRGATPPQNRWSDDTGAAADAYCLA